MHDGWRNVGGGVEVREGKWLKKRMGIDNKRGFS